MGRSLTAVPAELLPVEEAREVQHAVLQSMPAAVKFRGTARQFKSYGRTSLGFGFSEVSPLLIEDEICERVINLTHFMGVVLAQKGFGEACRWKLAVLFRAYGFDPENPATRYSNAEELYRLEWDATSDVAWGTRRATIRSVEIVGQERCGICVTHDKVRPILQADIQPMNLEDCDELVNRILTMPLSLPASRASA